MYEENLFFEKMSDQFFHRIEHQVIECEYSMDIRAFEESIDFTIMVEIYFVQALYPCLSACCIKQ